MKEISILIGGMAGDGIRQGAHLIGELFNELGYWLFIYDDYPSLISGGHNFSVIRAAEKQIFSHREKVDFAIAFNEETVKKHQKKWKKETILIYDSTNFKIQQGYGCPFFKIIQDYSLPSVMKNTIALGFFAGLCQINFSLVQKVVKKIIVKKIDENIKIAQEGYEEGRKIENKFNIKKLTQKPKILCTGNEATALGAKQAGLKIYFAYPMTPVTPILHFLAAHQKEFGVKVIQPENEIAVALMAEGAAYTGKRTMVGTSGGGFALMVESLSLAGQAEIPLLYVYGQRPGPSTGVPTYTAQADLQFVLKAGHGEFSRLVLAPSNVDEAFYLTGLALNLAWRYQIPAVVLTDKHLGESIFSATFQKNKVKEERPKIWSGRGKYQRYLSTKDGISPLAFPGGKAIVKSTGYEHNEFGLTVEESEQIKKMVEKRLKKQKTLEKELKKRKTINVYGTRRSKIALLTWGSTTGVVREIGEKLGLKVIQPLFLQPWPVEDLKKELRGVKKIIDIEMNTTGQLADLLDSSRIVVNQKILKYDGRPFTLDELENKIKKFL
ncbi:MAG: 2-oxoacid:acceptor oxidoreductase subunit alpha [Patescibacteria group bacterium]|nr:2-oxoacid:acceptor oxidoreductase subunit alpha [Patescibacteria group bacterium]